MKNWLLSAEGNQEEMNTAPLTWVKTGNVAHNIELSLIYSSTFFNALKMDNLVNGLPI